MAFIRVLDKRFVQCETIAYYTLFPPMVGWMFCTCSLSGNVITFLKSCPLCAEPPSLFSLLSERCHGQSIELRLLVSAFPPIRHLGQCSAHYCSFYKPYFMEFLSREISSRYYYFLKMRMLLLLLLLLYSLKSCYCDLGIGQKLSPSTHIHSLHCWNSYIS